MIQFSVFSGMIHRLLRRRQASHGLSLRVQPLPEPDPADILGPVIGTALLPLPWLLTGNCGAVGIIDTSPSGHSKSQGKWRYIGRYRDA